jgi:hypothetical protein
MVETGLRSGILQLIALSVQRQGIIEDIEMEHVDITPDWKTAVAIYVEVLIQTTDRYSDATTAARKDLMNLARMVDDMNAEARGITPVDPNQITLQFEDS